MKKAFNIFWKNKNSPFALGLIGIFGEIFLSPSSNSILLLVLLLYWLFLGIRTKLDEKYFFGLAMVFLILSVIPFLFGNFTLSERLSVWEFLFLILGLSQWFIFDIIVPKIKK